MGVNHAPARSVITLVPLLARTRNITLLVIAIVVGGVLLAAGCGSSSKGTPAPSGGSPTTVASQSKSGGYGY